MKSNKDYLLPNYNDGRFFISPILGCTGGCRYCYIKMKGYGRPIKNHAKIEDIYNTACGIKDFTFGKNGTIVSIGAWGDIFPKKNLKLL